jgi:hypothetical protein
MPTDFAALPRVSQQLDSVQQLDVISLMYFAMRVCVKTHLGPIVASLGKTVRATWTVQLDYRRSYDAANVK